MSDSYRAWAIDLRLPGHQWPCFWGILGPGNGSEPAPHLRGCRTSLWQTRREAREILRARKQAEGTRADGIYYWRGAVVRPVEVDIRLRAGGA